MSQGLQVIVTVSPSGGGKSHWAAINAPLIAAAMVNMDSIRAELCGDPSDQSRNAEVFCSAMSLAESHLRDGRSVIWDNTSLNPKARKEIIKLAKEYGARLVAVYFDCDVLTAKLRNAARDRKVGDHVIDSQFARWVKPTHDEGFDEILVMNTTHPSYQPTLI